MRTSLRRSLPTAAALATTAALGIGAFTATANASPQPAASTAQHQYCATVLAPLQANQTTSRVVTQQCSSQHAAGSDLPAGFAARRLTIIWTGYQYPNYKGRAYSMLAPSACANKTGYRVDTRPKQGWGISSWKAGARCWHTTIYYNGHQRGPHFTYRQGVWNAARLGRPFDNHVWSIWTRRK